MADQDPVSAGNGAGDSDAASVNILAQYTKDLSVENPSAPQVYQWQVQPQLDVQFNIGATLRALGRYVARNDRDASRLLGQFIDINQRKIRRSRRHRLRHAAPVTIETRGEIHDLQDIYDDLNLRYFANCIDARITWGQRNPPGASVATS